MSMSEEEYRQQAEALWREHDELQRLIEERCRLPKNAGAPLIRGLRLAGA